MEQIKAPLLMSVAVSCILLALCCGHFPITPQDLGQLLVGCITGQHNDTLAVVDQVFWHLRLPRILAAIVIGAGLSAAGAAYQGMFRNPLVSPDILGVSAGAGLGAVLGIFLGQSMLVIQLLAFVTGLMMVTLVCGVAKLSRRGDPVLSLVLVGLALSALCGAGISLFKLLADPYSQLPSITFWLMGGLSGISLHDVVITLPALLLGLLPLMLMRWRMNLLSLPDDEAKTLGLDVARTRLLFIACATLLTAAAVSLAGIIGWLGLVVPHIARLLVGPDFRRLLPCSMLTGASLLLLTDTLARSMTTIEIPLGILTSCLGAPFFVLLLIRGERN